MKKITQFAIAALLTSSVANVNAQGFLKKLADKANTGNKKEETKKGPGLEAIKPYSKDFTDDLGIGGTYLTADTIWLNDDIGRGVVYTEKKLNSNNNYYYATTVKIEYAREYQDKVVNALNFYTNEKDKGVYDNIKLDEKRKKTSNILYFTGYQVSYIVLEPGVIAKLGTKDEIVAVFAKDAAKLAAYDKETALAKYQQIMMAGKKEELKAEKAKWAANDVYKKMVGKIGFVKHYGQTGAAYGKIDETMETFISSFDFDKKAFYRAYFDMPPNTLCPNGCDQNIIYEMDGVKVSLLELRKSSAAWSNKLGSKRPPEDRFLSACPTLFDYNPVSLSDYAFMYLIYKSKAKFTGDKSFKIKMTITNNNAGVDKDVVATGQINLEYKATQKPTLDKIIELVEKVENQ
ncbi:MAG: hypothetical protein SFY56_10615 [Bacteroidota bacterium]|nr:hypothetical protein [Bacteroidota bacterium]